MVETLKIVGSPAQGRENETGDRRWIYSGCSIFLSVVLRGLWAFWSQDRLVTSSARQLGQNKDFLSIDRALAAGTPGERWMGVTALVYTARGSHLTV